MPKHEQASIDFRSYDSESDIGLEKIQQRVILIVGLTGSGKSSIIKSLCCPSDEEAQALQVKMAYRAVTQNLQEYTNTLIINPTDKDDKYSVTLIDTVGLGDGCTDVQTILRQIISALPTSLSRIHRIVFCFKMDRLRARMSEELSIMYNFFKMLGAKAENFVLCLTFCDILNNETIGRFWEELKECEDLEMVKEIKEVTYTSFPNFEECDNDIALNAYLKKKTKNSRRRVFESVILDKVRPFHPHEAMIRMPSVDFEHLCVFLKSYNRKPGKWYLGLFNKTEQDQMINLLKAQRPQVAEVPKVPKKGEKDPKKKGKDPPVTGIFFRQKTLSRQNVNE